MNNKKIHPLISGWIQTVDKAPLAILKPEALFLFWVQKLYT